MSSGRCTLTSRRGPADNPTYRVRAVNDLNHKGPWSSSLGPTGKSPQGAVEAPGAPLNVGATADGETAIDVFWDAPTDEGGAPITQYEVQWSADGTSGWRRAGYANDPQNRTYKHTGLSSGTTRHYRVAARNSGGRGTWSDPPAFATTLAGVADRPVLTVKSTTPNTIRVRWTEPRDNGGDITSYEIEWSADGSAESWQSLATVGVSDEGFDKREYSDTSVPAGDRRYYRARAVNEAGEWTLVGRGERGNAAGDADSVPGRAERSERHPDNLVAAGRRHGRQHGHELRAGGVHRRRE